MLPTGCVLGIERATEALLQELLQDVNGYNSMVSAFPCSLACCASVLLLCGTAGVGSLLSYALHSVKA
jgi:hypothetical protein